jgi:hypothetical protein
MIFKLLDFFCFFGLDVNLYVSIYFGETFFNVPKFNLCFFIKLGIIIILGNICVVCMIHTCICLH